MWSDIPVFISPKSLHSSNDPLRPYTFDECIPFSVIPPIRTHEKSDVGGSATHDEEDIPKGSLGPWFHFRLFISNISVVLEYFSSYVPPPITMMYFVDPSSASMVQLEW